MTRNGQNRVDSVTISCIAFAQIKLHSGKKRRHILTYAYFFVCLFVCLFETKQFTIRKYLKNCRKTGRNDSVRCRRVFKPQRVSKYIEIVSTKLGYLFLYWF